MQKLVNVSERDRFLAEKVQGCFHQCFKDALPITCGKCGALTNMNINPSTWVGFGELWEWSQKQVWWTDFLCCYGDGCGIYTSYVKPNSFANAIYEYLIEKEEAY